MTNEILNQDPIKTLTKNQTIAKLKILLNCSDLSKLKQTIQNYIAGREHVAIGSLDNKHQKV